MPSSVSNRSEEHTSELQSHDNLVCRLLLEKKQTPPRYPRPRRVARGAPHHRRRSPPGRAPSRPRCAAQVVPPGGGMATRPRFFFLNNRAPPSFPPLPPPGVLRV